MGQRAKVEVSRHKMTLFDLSFVSAPVLICCIRRHLTEHFGPEENWKEVRIERVHEDRYESAGLNFIMYRDETDEEMAARERRENDKRLTKEMEERAQLIVLKRKYEGAK